MKPKIFFCIFMLFANGIFAQGNSDLRLLNSLNYIQINSFSSPVINISFINDFIKLVDENDTKNVFFTNDLFLIQGSSIIYTLNRNGYSNIFDAKNGNDKGFINGESYYYAQEFNLQNQDEVNYFRNEGFITTEDYREALRAGFVNNSIASRRIRGLVTREYLQENIRYLNYIHFLQARTREQEILDNTDVDLIAGRFGNSITKLPNFDYYLIDITPSINNDSIFFYLCKFAGINNIREYNYTSEYNIKTTEQNYKRLSFDSLGDILDAAPHNVPNGNIYNLMRTYYITLDVFNQNQSLINELERIKQRYLNSIDFSTLDQDIINQMSSFRIANINRFPRRADLKSNYAFIIHELLKQEKGIPVSYDDFIRNVRNEYANNTLFPRFSINRDSIINVLEIPQIRRLFVVGNDSFYLR